MRDVWGGLERSSMNMAWGVSGCQGRRSHQWLINVAVLGATEWNWFLSCRTCQSLWCAMYTVNFWKGIGQAEFLKSCLVIEPFFPQCISQATVLWACSQRQQ